MDKPYDPAHIAEAVEQFEQTDLTPVEAMLASAQLLQKSLKAFREDAARFRAEHGDAVTHAFARQELNDLIYDLQDAIAPILRTFNSLLRDPGQKHDAPPG